MCGGMIPSVINVSVRFQSCIVSKVGVACLFFIAAELKCILLLDQTQVACNVFFQCLISFYICVSYFSSVESRDVLVIWDKDQTENVVAAEVLQLFNINHIS